MIVIVLSYDGLVLLGQTAFFIFRQDKRVWNSSQVPLTLTLHDGTENVNKRNVMCF